MRVVRDKKVKVIEIIIQELKPWFHVKIKLFQRILVFYFNMERRLKWNKIILAAKIILFYFKRGSVLK